MNLTQQNSTVVAKALLLLFLIFVAAIFLIRGRLTPSMKTTRIGWTTPDSDDAFLTLDRNNNGMIDNGKELFGNFTAQPLIGSSERVSGFS